MPATPPFPFKSAPSGEVPPLPPVTVVQQPVMSVSYPEGCAFPAFAVLELDTLPVMNRQPQSVPDIPGGGWSYQQFLEYLDLGIAPHDDGVYDRYWTGLGAWSWSILIDGVASGDIIIGYDGSPGPFRAQVNAAVDWTVSHTWQLSATYFDRPAYSEFWFNPATIGIIAFGPGTQVADPNVYYTLAGIEFGCQERNAAFFPSAFWGDPGVSEEEWVVLHRGVGDVLGPVDRYGNYLGLTGPWGSAVPVQYLSSGPGEVPCNGAGPEPGALPSGPGGAGDVYATSLGDLYETTTYARHEYTVTSSTQSLAACSTPTAHPVFDVTKAHKVHH